MPVIRWTRSEQPVVSNLGAKVRLMRNPRVLLNQYSFITVDNRRTKIKTSADIWYYNSIVILRKEILQREKNATQNVLRELNV